jgi:hypothetical protein
MSMDFDELQEEAKRLKQGNAGNYLDNFVRLPEGAGHVVLRLLPAARPGTFGRSKNPFFQRTRTHRVNDRSFHCRKEFVGGKWVGDCEICNYTRWLWTESERKSKEEADKLQQQYRNLKAVERYYYNCMVRQQYNKDTGEIEKNVGPKIFSVSKTVHEMILSAMMGNEALEEKGYGDVTDFVNGRDFKYIKTIKQGNSISYPDFATSKFMDVSPLGNPDEIEKWMNNLTDLTTLRVVKTNDELKHQLKIHLGLIADTVQGAYDPSEYGGMAAATGSSAKVEKVEKVERIEVPASLREPAVEKPVVDAPPVVKDTGSKPLIDEDFLNELRNA